MGIRASAPRTLGNSLESNCMCVCGGVGRTGLEDKAGAFRLDAVHRSIRICVLQDWDGVGGQRNLHLYSCSRLGVGLFVDIPGKSWLKLFYNSICLYFYYFISGAKWTDWVFFYFFFFHVAVQSARTLLFPFQGIHWILKYINRFLTSSVTLFLTTLRILRFSTWLLSAGAKMCLMLSVWWNWWPCYTSSLNKKKHIIRHNGF